MHTPIVLVRTLLFALAVLVAATLAQAAPAPLAAGQPLNPGAKKKASPSTALVVVQQKYPKPFRELGGATLEAAQLAAQLCKAGYRVVLVADGPLDAKAQAALVVKGGEVSVRQAATAKALDKELGDWLAEVARDQPTLALLVLSGHGEERNKEAFFLTVDDAPGKGGVSFDALRQSAETAPPKGLYLTMVYDACRTPAPPAAVNPAPALKVVGPDGKPVEPPPAGVPAAPMLPPDTRGNYEYLQRRERGLRVIAPRPKAAVAALTPTVLYSTRSSERAVAEKGLVHYLTEALSSPKVFDEFLKLMAPGQVGRPEMRLYDWAHFAVARLQAQELTQSHELVVGSVPLTQAVVVRGAGGAAQPQVRDAYIDLLAKPLARDMGDFEMEYDSRIGLTITRPEKGVAAPWAGCLIPPGGGIDPSGKVLVVDVVAEHPKMTRGELIMSVNPFRRPPEGKYLNLHSGIEKDSDLLPAIPFANPKRITLPLRAIPDATGKPQPLDALGWASAAVNSDKAWTPQTSLTVIGMTLVAQPPNGKLGAAVQPLDFSELTRDIWLADDAFTGDGVLHATRKPGMGGQFQLEPQAGFAGKSRCGGALVPPRYVPRGHSLQFDAWTTNGKPAEVVVDLLYIDPLTAAVTAYADRESVTIPPQGPGQRPKQIPLAERGSVNYLRLSTKDAGVHIKSIRIVQSK